MTIKIGGKQYIPGMYSNKKPTGKQLADNYFQELDKKLIEKERTKNQPIFYPTISFSRKIGVGALEIANILSEDIGYHVVDREILMHIANESKLNEKTVAFFDERYPGKTKEFLKFLFGEKSFIKSDYSNSLFSSVISLAGLKPTIFVGRGTHLILPRDRVLAVRFICSDNHRIKRLASILEVKTSEVAAKLEQIDKEQNEFFKKTFGKKDASPYEFDMVINCDYINDPHSAARIVANAFKEKFGSEIGNK
jgi:cytidylate kinase